MSLIRNAGTPWSGACSVVIPTRNGPEKTLRTVDRLDGRLTIEDEIIIVENSDSDAAFDTIVAALSQRPTGGAAVHVLRSAPGIGIALGTGVRATTGKVVLLTGDDLPFGFSDVDAITAREALATIVIGSKAHPASEITRPTLRTVYSGGFRFLRTVLLRTSTGDTQGTFIARGDAFREIASYAEESGALWTTEVVCIAQRFGLVVAEVPIVYFDDGAPSRFGYRDAMDTAVGLLRVRNRLSKLPKKP
jgi:dolichyl-phosphate beta-glucosyltransferase